MISTFAQAVQLTMIRMHAGNWDGAIATLSSVFRLAEKGRETHGWIGGNLENAIKKQDLWWLPTHYKTAEKPSDITAEVIEEWELMDWDRAHEIELDQQAELDAEHGYDPFYAFDVKPEYNYKTYPEYLWGALARRKTVIEAALAAKEAEQEAALAGQHAEWGANGFDFGKETEDFPF